MSLDPATIGIAATGLNAAGGLLGGSKRKTQAAVPPDLVGPRRQQIALLQYLLGYGGGGPGASPMGRGGKGASWTGGLDINGPGGMELPGMGDPTGRLESFFGGLGVPQSDLQRQASGGISEFLKTNPEAKAFEALNQILGTNPGTSTMNALQPQFERNLSAANAAGPRFGTANAIAKTRAVDDFNLLSANALMQGVQQQIQASEALRALGDSAFNRLTGAYGVGKDEAAQADIATQRRLQLLQYLLSTMQSATLGLPLQQTGGGPNFLQTLGNSGMDLATFLGGIQKPVSKAG